MNTTNMIDTIMEMDESQISHMVDAINARRRAIQQGLKNALNLGDKVKFQYKGTTKVGTVVKRLVKNVRVETSNQIWDIAPSLLTKIN
jgi:hypothetical protein